MAINYRCSGRSRGSCRGCCQVAAQTKRAPPRILMQWTARVVDLQSQINATVTLPRLKQSWPNHFTAVHRQRERLCASVPTPGADGDG
jgi:hypothetical protein